ncbi:MAG: lysylphosphatidylglycerol synthase transmembrane domain-containing protein [Sulfurihydrogenibium sp.]|uniref:lysylphosphatidylglycerol synthase transmembrane domain-containing protein n=1 Tax=Sulfurihydrogenibium sp. TaxID=2053621 RepID=UPI003D0DA6B6
MNKTKLLKLFISALVTVLFFYFFQRIVGFDKVLKFFSLLTLNQILAAFVLYLISYIARTVRWQYTLSIKDFYKLFKLTVYNTFFNIILPFRTGEVSFFYMLKKENIHIVESTMSFIITRFFDGISLLGLFLWAYLTYKGFYILGILAFIFLPFSFFVLLIIFRFIKHEKVKEYYKGMVNFRNIVMVYALSILTWLFKFSAFYIILPKETKITLLESVMASSLADLTTVLPIHGLAGIGTYETGYISILIFLNVPKEVAFLSAFLVHMFIIVSSSFIAATLYLVNFKKI